MTSFHRARDRDRLSPSGWQQLLALGGLSLLLLTVLSLVGALFLDEAGTADLTKVNSATVILAVSAGSLLTVVGIAFVLARRGSLTPGRVFAWRPRSIGVLGAALGLGLSVAPFASWFAESLVAVFDVFSVAHLDQIAGLLSEGSPRSRATALALVLVIAPLCEELLFRGFLWDCFERELGRVAAFLLCSSLFALYHADPLHTVSVLPLTLLVGILRLRTGSVMPAIAVHFGNNLMSVLLLWWAGASGTLSVPWSVALACLIVSLVALVAGSASQSLSEGGTE